MEDTQGPNKAVIGIIVVVLLAVVGGGTFYLVQQNNSPASSGSTTTTDTTSSSASATSSTDANSTSSGTYTDGSYDAEANFQTPDGVDAITVNVTLKDGIITSVNADTQSNSRESQQYDDAFLARYQGEVEGKTIDEVQLRRVAGASLTSNGFNDALDEIRQNANA